jgi:hypothetical protein
MFLRKIRSFSTALVLICLGSLTPVTLSAQVDRAPAGKKPFSHGAKSGLAQSAIAKVAPGTNLFLSDDSFIRLPLPFTFEICGRAFNDVYVNSNGNLTFGSGDFNYVEHIPGFLFGPPRIAAVWDDLNPATGGQIFYTQTKNTFTVTWWNVPEYFLFGANTFSIELQRASHHIDLVFGDLTLNDGLTGVSCGNGITTGLEPLADLSVLAPRRINLHNHTAFYELFTPAIRPFDLQNSAVLFNGTTSYSTRDGR